jgi:hypothetical protein
MMTFAPGKEEDGEAKLPTLFHVLFLWGYRTSFGWSWCLQFSIVL